VDVSGSSLSSYPMDGSGSRQRLEVSVVVPTRNRGSFVNDLIGSILAGNSAPAEIIVIDQSDVGDPSVSELSDADTRVAYRRIAPFGASAARNEGIRRATSDMLVFVDDDVIVASEWLRNLVSTLRTAGERAVVSGLFAEGEPEGEGAFAPSLKSDTEAAVYEGRSAANVLWSGNMAMFRSTVEQIGYFDERLGPGKRRFPGGGEDNDYCFRLLEAGYRIVYEPRAVVHHRAWRPAHEYVATQWRYGRGQGGFYAKHMRLRDPYILGQFTRHVINSSGEAVRQARRDPRVAAGNAAYAAGIVSAAGEWLLTERLLNRARRR
jgi:GT2 family glycosyltransferase